MKKQKYTVIWTRHGDEVRSKDFTLSSAALGYAKGLEDQGYQTYCYTFTDPVDGRCKMITLTEEGDE